MATPIDITLIGTFLPAFSFLLVFTICYALLSKTKILGDNTKLNLLAALCVSVIFLFTPEALDIVKLTTPWFIIFVIFLILIFMTFLFLGAKQETIQEALKSPVVAWSIVIIITGIFLWAFVQIFGNPIQAIYANGNGGGSEAGGLMVEVGKIVFHPRMLGAIFILAVAAGVVRLIVGGEK